MTASRPFKLVPTCQPVNIRAVGKPFAPSFRCRWSKLVIPLPARRHESTARDATVTVTYAHDAAEKLRRGLGVALPV